MLPGDRAVFNEEITITQETVDGNARFIEHVNKIIDEIDTGLQSSANRVIAEPSAMADAREAGSADDDRTLGMMAKWTAFMNREVIPRVTGLKAGQLVWKWGAKDAFDLEFPEALEKAIDKRIIRPEQAAVLLEDQYHWKIPSMEDVEEKLGIKIAEEQPEGDKPLPTTDPKLDKDPNPPEAAPGGESVKVESETDKAIKEEKLNTLKFINKKLQENTT